MFPKGQNPIPIRFSQISFPHVLKIDPTKNPDEFSDFLITSTARLGLAYVPIRKLAGCKILVSEFRQDVASEGLAINHGQCSFSHKQGTF
jgi:hypothetical protein